MTKTILFIPSSIFAVCLSLVGCGGGGGSALVKPVVTVPVTAPTLTTNSTVLLDTVSNEVDYLAIGNIALSVQDKGISETSTTALTYDSGGSLSKVVITTPNSVLTWDSANGDSVSALNNFPSHIVLQDAANTYTALTIDPKSSPWDYQTFGTWRTGFGSGSGTIGVSSEGLRTEGAAVPMVGSATFTGTLLGVYIFPTGGGTFVQGDVSIDSDFVARSLSFSTSGTQRVDLSGATVAIPQLDMSGTLTYNSGVNSFSGAVTAAGAGLTGTANGVFYGPNAEELGGVFNVKGTGVEFYSGSFGANK